MSRSDTSRRGWRGQFGPVLHPVLLAIFALCLGPELVLGGADLGLWGSPEWRLTSLQYFGFWTGLLGDWRPNYPLQWLAMFATYGFVHASLSHFALNMVTLFSIGAPVVDRLGGRRFAILYVVSLVGGALGFALLSRVVAPMVGASGALFGLIGALIAWDYADLRARGASPAPVVKAIAWLTVLNLALWWAMNGHLAWQTHLGGFVAGWLAARHFARQDR